MTFDKKNEAVQILVPHKVVFAQKWSGTDLSASENLSRLKNEAVQILVPHKVVFAQKWSGTDLSAS